MSKRNGKPGKQSGALLQKTGGLALGAAIWSAGLVAAQAADLPSKAAAPVEYVRVCSQFGSGFFYVPGTDTCIKLAGRVRADYIFTEPFSRQTNTTTFRGRGYL